ncbi:MAG: radical SAM family heme chaperone HemW [Clostridia bacterium]|nr:radical SAM family heme chaperone HemW [Clostridia bacterium]
METISLYIHIPLCVKKCAYCDFASFSGRMAQRDCYVQAVCREIRAQAAFFGRRRVATVFFGGGTPTLLSGAQITEMMRVVRECFDVLPDAEITMEGNPGTLDMENLRAYRAAGVNRLSLGVQSMDDKLLAAIGRIHTAKEAEDAVAMARKAGFENINLDLMYGLPGQNAIQWKETLQKAIGLAPEHLSCYSLILEEGTPLYDSVNAGECAPLPDEETMESMDALTLELTAAAGYSQYEVSNYAKPDRQCRHNIVYWECLPYLGVGLGAHSDMDRRRFYNPAEWESYLQMTGNDAAQRKGEGSCSQQERMFERMMMGLRQTRGVDAARFERDFGCTIESVWPETIAQMTRKKLMTSNKERILLTPRGMQVMNGVLVSLMEEAEKQGIYEKTLIDSKPQTDD